MSSFGKTRYFDGKLFKLGTLHKGVTKSKAQRTAQMNWNLGNKARVVQSGKKYATYVRKT